MKRILLAVVAGAALALGGLLTSTAQADHKHHRRHHIHHHGCGCFDPCGFGGVHGGYRPIYGSPALYGRGLYGPGLYGPGVYSGFGYRSYRSPGVGLYLRF